MDDNNVLAQGSEETTSSLDSAKQPSKTKKGGSRERQHKLLYDAAYMDLSDSILSKEGKKIVAKDPNLSDDTLKKLLALQGGNLKDVQFNFGLPNWGEANDAGCALLSCCIKDNYNSTWAELVGRYADMRRKPFLEIALGLKQYHAQYGLAYYNNSHELVPWEPYILKDLDEDELNSAMPPELDDDEVCGTKGLVSDLDSYIKKTFGFFW